MKMNDGAHLEFAKDHERRQFIDERDMVRLIEEEVEAYRRRAVKNKKCTEEDSRDWLAKELNRMEKEEGTPEERAKRLRAFKQVKELLDAMPHPERFLEKEYYFDEGLGQSLHDHCQELKTKWPGLQIETRRDRDGYAIVKTKYKPNYKYDLDEILNYDPAKASANVKESIDAVLKLTLGKDTD